MNSCYDMFVQISRSTLLWEEKLVFLSSNIFQKLKLVCVFLKKILILTKSSFKNGSAKKNNFFKKV